MRPIYLIILIIALASCEIKPRPIAYGTDACQYCKMAIVDRQHAAQLVTAKGRIYNFDAVECLINFSPQLDEEDIALRLCNHFTEPGELIPAEEAYYLISEGIPSPMGAFLTAFRTNDLAKNARREHGGEVFTWNELLNHWKDNYVFNQ